MLTGIKLWWLDAEYNSWVRSLPTLTAWGACCLCNGCLQNQHWTLFLEKWKSLSYFFRFVKTGNRCRSFVKTKWCHANFWKAGDSCIRWRVFQGEGAVESTLEGRSMPGSSGDECSWSGASDEEVIRVLGEYIGSCRSFKECDFYFE